MVPSLSLQLFMLNARLAAAESMTHDVIRDLLGVKLDMANYAVRLHFHLLFELLNSVSSAFILPKQGAVA